VQQKLTFMLAALFFSKNNGTLFAVNARSRQITPKTPCFGYNKGKGRLFGGSRSIDRRWFSRDR
jgi:hypothetical protein